MKRFIVSASNSNAIFSDPNFELVYRSGVGMQDTPWKGLEVISKGLAKKHAVEIRLDTKGWNDFNGEPFNYDYTGATVAHGMRMQRDTLDDTREYIAVLEDAVAFAEKINDWLAAGNLQYPEEY